MKSSYAKKLSVTVPADLEEELQKAAKREHRTLSGVIHEAARFYLSVKEWEDLQRKVALKAATKGIRTEEDVDSLVHEMRLER